MPDTVSRTPPGALPYCEAVCTGYLSTFALVMQRLGIQSKIIGPQDMLRTRNVTRIDGSWYHSGVTWDDMHEGIGPQRFHSMMSEQTLAPGHACTDAPAPSAARRRAQVLSCVVSKTRTSPYEALSTVSNSCSSLGSSARMTPRSTTDSTASTSTRRLNTRAQSSSFSQPYP